MNILKNLLEIGLQYLPKSCFLLGVSSLLGVALRPFFGVINDDFRGVFCTFFFEGVFVGLFEDFFLGVFSPLTFFLGDWNASNFKFLLQIQIKKINLIQFHQHKIRRVCSKKLTLLS